MTWFAPPPGMALDEYATACIESGSGGLLLDEGAPPPEFFDLSTRAAGTLLHELGKYRIPLAAVVPDPEAYSPAFKDFVRESNRGHRVRFFPDRAQAEAWLQRAIDE